MPAYDYSASSMHGLYVEPEPILRREAQDRMNERFGSCVALHGAASYSQAIAWIDLFRPDFVITRYRFSGPQGKSDGGQALTRHLSEHYPLIAYAILSHETSDCILKELSNVGVVLPRVRIKDATAPV